MAANRYTNEVSRLYGVLNTQLQGRDYITGDYTIADMLSWPWVFARDGQGIMIDDFPHIKSLARARRRAARRCSGLWQPRRRFARAADCRPAVERPPKRARSSSVSALEPEFSGKPSRPILRANGGFDQPSPIALASQHA